MDVISGFWAATIDLARRRDLGCGEPLLLHELAARCGGWGALSRADRPGLEAAGARPEVADRLLASRSMVTQGRALTAACPAYPSSLRAWTSAVPPVLFVEGDPTVLERPSVAIVGTRSCSPYGASVAHRIGWACARAGITVISGLARGIDTHAHQGALSGHGPTVAVLGHGLLHTSPVSNRDLRRKIVDHGGAVLTTLPDPVPPSKRTFPERNEWIAGLARIVVVVEAPERSGALITAHTMMERNAERVWVVPGPFAAETWRGSHALLGFGATPMLEIEPLLRELDADVPPARRHADWLAAVLSGSDLDEAARIGRMSTVEVLRELTRLELDGTVVRLPGGRYAPAGESP